MITLSKKYAKEWRLTRLQPEKKRQQKSYTICLNSIDNNVGNADVGNLIQISKKKKKKYETDLGRGWLRL